MAEHITVRPVGILARSLCLQTQDTGRDPRGKDVTIPVRNLGTGLRRGLAYRFGTKSIRGNSRPLMLLLGGLCACHGARIASVVTKVSL